MLLIDAANVVGSVPDGWWRDRAGAAGRLLERLRAAAAASSLEGPVVVVLEGAARAAAPESAGPPVRVVHAPGAGDETLVAVAAAAGGPVTLVSADRELGRRCRAVGADVVGPAWLLGRLPEP